MLLDGSIEASNVVPATPEPVSSNCNVPDVDPDAMYEEPVIVIIEPEAPISVALDELVNIVFSKPGKAFVFLEG